MNPEQALGRAPVPARYLNGKLVSVIATDYGGTISLDRIDHLIGQKPVDPAAAAALRILYDDLGLRLVLASNTQPHETRWPALQQAGIDGLFTAAVLSYPLGVRKPFPVFYQVMLATVGCPAGQVLFVGDHLETTQPPRPGTPPVHHPQPRRPPDRRGHADPLLRPLHPRHSRWRASLVKGNLLHRHHVAALRVVAHRRLRQLRQLLHLPG